MCSPLGILRIPAPEVPTEWDSPKLETFGNFGGVQPSLHPPQNVKSAHVRQTDLELREVTSGGGHAMSDNA